MLLSNKASNLTKNLITIVIFCGVFVAAARPQSSDTAQKSVAKTAIRTAGPSYYHAERFGGRAGRYYAVIWGVDSLTVKSTESGEVIRFSYRVLDADKAEALNDKKAEPFLIDPKAGVRLVVPSLEKVGQLRQSSTPELGKSYWMAFSNKGQRVKRGDRVNIVIGKFRADDLVVD
jgi:hypothetical protein